MIRYVIGSSDSLDIDTCYIVSVLPSPQECKHFCDNLIAENANLATIENGEIGSCYKGTPDEMTNCILDTYSLHEQTSPLLITHRVKRNTLIKDMRAIRGILSYMSRTQYREQIKLALRSGFGKRIEILNDIELSTIDFNQLDKKFNGKNALKVFAFQIGQARGLHEGVELYTKKDIATTYPQLKPYLYRETLNTGAIQKELRKYLAIVQNSYKIENEQGALSTIDGVTYNLRYETIAGGGNS